MNDVVIKVIGLIDGGVTGFDGQYVMTCDAGRVGVEPLSGRAMTCYLVTTPHLAKATRYDPVEAFELWRQVDPGQPVRPDGEPNRPFTAFSIEMAAPERFEES